MSILMGEKTDPERQRLAALIGPHYLATGVMFDVTLTRVGRRRVARGYVYGDKRGRVPDGWWIRTSLIEKTRKVSSVTLVVAPNQTVKVPEHLVITTLNSTYVTFMKENKDASVTESSVREDRTHGM